MRVRRIWSAPRQIWDTGMIGASGEKAIVQVRHLQGGNRGYQTWVIMGKHIGTTEVKVEVLDGNCFGCERFCKENHDPGASRASICTYYLENVFERNPSSLLSLADGSCEYTMNEVKAPKKDVVCSRIYLCLLHSCILRFMSTLAGLK